MTRSPAPRRSRMLRAGTALALAVGLAAGVLGLTLMPGDAASASLGSVPAEVSAYVTDGSMVARLNDVYGPNASGTEGITFDDTTKPGPISRVYEWTDARLANRTTDHPVQLTNNWAVPITVAGKSVGLATIWINPQTVEPELADFAPGAALGTALTTVPAKAALVRDPATGAWLALADGTVTPLVAGSSGLSTPVPVASLKLSPAAPAPLATGEPNTGLALAIGIIALIVIVIVVALLLPRRRRSRLETVPPNETAADAAPATEAAIEQAAEPATETAIEQAAEPASEPATVTAAEPAAAESTTPRPAGRRPSGRTPTTSSAAKPAASKPPATKPAASKPAVSKPPARTQPPRPRAPKPPAGPEPDSDS